MIEEQERNIDAVSSVSSDDTITFPLNDPSSSSQDSSSQLKDWSAIHSIVKNFDEGLSTVEHKLAPEIRRIREDIEEDRQYSRKNSILLHNFQNLPNLKGTKFICYIAN